MIEENPILRWLWPVLAALAGAVTALSLRAYKQMSPVDIGMALFVGTTFSLFVAPIVAQAALGYEPQGIRVVGAIYWIMAAGSNILIPLTFRWIKKFVGAPAPEDEA